jgi:hypothetical protein
MIIRVILFIILSFGFLGSKGQVKSKSIKLEYFDTNPTNGDGCEGNFTYDTISVEKGKFIFFTDLRKLAYIKVGGKNISLKNMGYVQLSKKKSKSTFKGGGYTIILTTTTVKEYDEGGLEAGTLEISNGVDKEIIKVHGESGC